jgi:hypothetical protein
VVAGRRLAGDPVQARDCGWGGLLPNARVHVLDSEHVELLEEPVVAELAEIFLDGLRRSDKPDLVPAHVGAPATNDLELTISHLR